jgi:hypothetical protein
MRYFIGRCYYVGAEESGAVGGGGASVVGYEFGDGGGGGIDVFFDNAPAYVQLYAFEDVAG